MKRIVEIRQTGRGLLHFNIDRDAWIELHNGSMEPLLVGDAVLCHRHTLFWFGKKAFSWWVKIRTVPCWEWAKCAIGDLESLL